MTRWLRVLAPLLLLPLPGTGGHAPVTPPADLVPPPPAIATPRAVPPEGSVLHDHLLVCWYGNPWTARMGILGRLRGAALADGLRAQAAAYARLTNKTVIPAYQLVAVIAQGTPGSDGLYRRRESREVIERMLGEARAAGFKLILDVQPGRSTVRDELAWLSPWLAEPDVYLALDPEFAMGPDGIPGERIGHMSASDVNDAIAALDDLIVRRDLPPKVLIVHQFTMAMMPDKDAVIASPAVDVVLDMDGFGSRSLKRQTYRMILRQHPLEFTGVKLFYQQDDPLFAPAQVLALKPPPSVIIYQ